MSEALVQEFEIRAGAATAEAPDWLEPARRAAMERFARTGFPTARDEEWRFTPLAPIAQGTWRLPHGVAREGQPREQLAPFIFGHAEWTTLVFVNGAYSESLSSIGLCPAASGSGASPRRFGATARCSSSISPVTRRSRGAPSPR